MLTSRSLLTEGMFVDGVTYASVSRNMAEGQGTFWDPSYTQTLYPHFRQHPPLALGLEALAFRALGDHLYVEKSYSVLAFLLSGLLIALIWKRSTNHFRWAWIPLLFWIFLPLVTWSATNNLLENTMTVFVLLSVYLMVVSYQRNSKTWLLLAGGALFAAFLSKGFTGLFPLAFPLFYCIFDDQRHWIQGPVDSILVLTTVAALTGGMLLLVPESFPYLKDYVRLQVIGGGMHEPTVTTRWFIVLSLLQQLIVPVAILIALFVLKKILQARPDKVFEFPPDRKWFLVFLLTGLCGVLPIMVSVKQRDFYMIAALPFFALALGHLSLSTVNALLMQIRPKSYRWLRLGAWLLLLVGAVLNVSHLGSYGRDEALIPQVKQVRATMGEERVIGIDPADFDQWTWHAYFMRYGKVSLDDKITDQTIYSYF